MCHPRRTRRAGCLDIPLWAVPLFLVMGLPGYVAAYLGATALWGAIAMPWLVDGPDSPRPRWRAAGGLLGAEVAGLVGWMVTTGLVEEYARDLLDRAGVVSVLAPFFLARALALVLLARLGCLYELRAGGAWGRMLVLAQVPAAATVLYLFMSARVLDSAAGWLRG